MDGSGDVIAILEEKRVSLYGSISGRWLWTGGIDGTGPGQLRRPHSVRVLVGGMGFVVADEGNNRLALFNLSGAHAAVLP